MNFVQIHCLPFRVLAKRREIQLPPASFTILHTPPLPMQGKRFHQFLQTQTARRERQVVLPVGMMVWRFRWRALSRCTFLLLVRQKMSGVLSSEKSSLEPLKVTTQLPKVTQWRPMCTNAHTIVQRSTKRLPKSSKVLPK